jgi:hypothetical protein
MSLSSSAEIISPKTSPKYFTILGERCSGTHFLQHAIAKNFEIKYLKGEKHFFGNKEFRDNIDDNEPLDQLSLHERQMREIDTIAVDELLVFAIVRDPVEWIDSFYKRKHHVPNINKEPYENFISCEFYSVYEEGIKKGQEIMEDRHWLTKDRYKDLFELRYWKCKYMLEELPNKYIHYYFVKYEDLRDNYIETLDQIHKSVGLLRKTDVYEKVPKYKGTYNALYEKKPILLNEMEILHIWEKIDTEQENKMGYFQHDVLLS